MNKEDALHIEALAALSDSLGEFDDVAVRESGRISELKCLELFEGIVPGFAVMQQNLKQHLVKVSRGWRAILQAGC